MAKKATKKREVITVNKIVAAMCDDDLLNESIAFNLMANVPYVRGELPWDVSRKERAWGDEDLSALYAYMQDVAHIGRSKSELIDALSVFLIGHRYHPVREWLRSLPKWDGTPRVSTLFHDFLGADVNSYVATVTWLLMYGAIARVERPGCKFDIMTVLQGHQGLKKSSLVRALAVRDEWLVERTPDTKQVKDFAEILRNKWFVEVAELDGMNGRDVNAVKATITTRTDTYRAPYARYTQDHPRQCVFVGTCNDGAFLTDMTGNRRFVIVECGHTVPRFDPLRPPCGYMTQVWAEAWGSWRSQGGNAKLYLDGEMEREANTIRDAYMSGGDTVGKVREWLLSKRSRPVCAAMVTERCLGIERSSARYASVYREAVKILDNQCPNWERYRSKTHKTRIPDYGVVLAWAYYGEDGGNTSDQRQR